jgi:ketosteroid isomerase-like protein
MAKKLGSQESQPISDKMLPQIVLLRQIEMRRVSAISIVVTVLLCGCFEPKKESRMEESPRLTQTILALREAYAAFNRGDMDAAVASLDPQIEWIEPAEFPGGGTYHGRDAAKAYLTQSRAAWAEVISEPERFITAGDHVVVFVHARVLPKGGKEWQEVRVADVYTIRDGKLVGMHAFADRQEALRWAGAQDSSR